MTYKQADWRLKSSCREEDRDDLTFLVLSNSSIAQAKNIDPSNSTEKHVFSHKRSLLSEA